MLSPSQQVRAARAFILDRLEASDAAAAADATFRRRLDVHFPRLFDLFTSVYGEREDCLDHLAELVALAARSWGDRAAPLRELDAAREANPGWFQSEGMVGGVCYADRYAGDLRRLREHIPYFRDELGLTYLHLMPLFRCPEENSDGGYAVSSYREINPGFGTMEDLRALATELRESGISLVIDFIFNHTSNEHEWARKAVAGDPECAGYYWIFPDRTLPDAYDRTTREIFPDDHPGSFVQLEDGRWIWSTFYSFQWDLNYSNPATFRAMAGEMLFLANVGVDFLRMDAVAFIWKRMGTTCESLPEAHTLIRAFNAVCRIAAPSLLFKSEAIVHPDEVVSYIDPEECPLSYNPLLMALGWEALATRDARLLGLALARRQRLKPGCAWVNYVRSHDDIGWTFADEEAAELGIVGHDHRRFLNAFYNNRFPGSFARGVPFQENPRTGDARVSGATASLAGIEAGDPLGVDRVALLHGLALSAGGVPLIYLGDEVGQLNDYGYADHPAKRGDTRWVHRPERPAALYEARRDEGTTAGALFARLKRLIDLRRATPALAGGEIAEFWTGDDGVLGYQRFGSGEFLLALANFTDGPRTLAEERFSAVPPRMRDLVADAPVEFAGGLTLAPYRLLWLVP